MKNWKTTIYGLIAAISLVVEQQLTEGSVNWHTLLIACAIAGLGVLSKDFNGGNTPTVSILIFFFLFGGKLMGQTSTGVTGHIFHSRTPISVIKVTSAVVLDSIPILGETVNYNGERFSGSCFIATNDSAYLLTLSFSGATVKDTSHVFGSFIYAVTQVTDTSVLVTKVINNLYASPNITTLLVHPVSFESGFTMYISAKGFTGTGSLLAKYVKYYGNNDYWTLE